MRRQMLKMAVMLLCVLSLLMDAGECVAYAKTGELTDSFSGDVAMLKQENNSYIMQVTVENSGEDFTGTVQVIFAGSGYGNCAYNTEITLPAQGKKQFTITVSDRAVDTMHGLCALNFLDENGNVLQSVSLKNVFGNTMSGIPVGILSDNYSGLTYMDAGGLDFDIEDISYPLKLVELNNDNLGEYLDGLYFLIIDQFNVSSLSEENIQAIQDWVEGGGWLLIGTGAYAEQTLSGFDEDFIDVDVLDISEPGEKNIASANAEQYGYYYEYIAEEIDFTNTAVADLNYNRMNGLYESTDNPAICGAFEEGAVSIFLCSFGEKELQKMSNYMIQYIYGELMYCSESYYLNGYSEMEYVGQRLLAFIDNINTDVNFTGLRVGILIYVVLVGPVLYLILRKCKKREWYWIGAPVLGILFIAGVFFLGQGVRINETRVYSVTAQRADGNRADTYFLAYHSGVKPWEMRLTDNYEVAGPGWNGYYRSSTQSTDDYHYIVSSDSEGLSVGIKPEENFESGFLYAGGRTESKGTISCGDLKGTGGNISGTITNETSCDMAYMAVWSHSYIMVFSDVKAGETVDLQQAVRDGRCVYYEDSVFYYEDLLYSMVSIYSYRSDMKYEQDDMAALLIGIGIADDAMPAGPEQAVIAGVVRDYEQAVASKCNEISYGCLYSYAEIGGDENNASNRSFVQELR